MHIRTVTGAAFIALAIPAFAYAQGGPAAGAAAGAAGGAVVGGPAGAAVGAIGGAIIGGIAGQDAAEQPVGCRDVRRSSSRTGQNANYSEPQAQPAQRGAVAVSTALGGVPDSTDCCS